MSDSIFWQILQKLTTDKFDSWWVTSWYSWLVYLAFTVTFALFLLVILRYALSAGRNARSKSLVLLSLMGLVLLISLLLITPSLLLRFFPSAVLVIAGLGHVQNLQKVTYPEWLHVIEIFRWVSWMGIVGGTAAIVMLIAPNCRRVLLKDIAAEEISRSTMAEATQGSGTVPPPPYTPVLTPLNPAAIGANTPYSATNTPYTPTPQYPSSSQKVSVNLEELTPLPLEKSKPGDVTPPPQELTPLPRESLPVAAWLQAISYGPEKKEYIFKLETVIVYIGRERADIVLDEDPSISRKHASIEYKLGQFYFRDYSSRRSSWVDEQPVISNEVVRLRNGARLRLGESEFYFHVMHWPEIRILSGPMKDKIVRGRRTPITIGAGEANHIRVKEDEGILDVHARIQLDYETKQFVLDPVSDQQININSKRPDGPAPWPLYDDSKISIGRNSFSLHLVKEETR